MRGSRFLMAIVLGGLLAMAFAPAAVAETGGSERPLHASAAGYGYWPGVGAEGSLDCPGYIVGETTFVYLEGTMTHLGRVHVEMRHCTFYPDLGELFTDTGVIDVVAANGDRLRGTYATWLTDIVGDHLTSGFEISFDGTGSTGRFAGATGSADGEIALTVLGYEVLVWPATSWQIAGTITY